MDLTLLRAFVTVAREGNLTRAAVQLHLTQPAVSLQIKHLQETLGVTLFTRTSHGLSLTRDGQALLPHAERALGAASDVQRAAASLRHEVRGRLRIGTILDPAFLRLAAFHAVTLTHFQYRVLAPAGWKDRVKGARDWRSLAALPWIWTPPASAHNRLLSRCFDEAGVKPVKVAEVDQEPSMLDLVKSGVGLTLARDATAIAEAHAHALTIVEGITVPTQLSFITLAERRDEPAIAAA